MPGLIRKLNSYYLSLLLDTRSFLGLSPRCFALVQRLSPTRRIQNLVGRNTDLCFEAPSGSGNSYFVNGFRKINPDVCVAHHHHVAAQVARGVLFKIPTVVILRDPIACVVSRTSFWKDPILIGPVFRQWIRFFQVVEQVQNHVLIVTFESVTKKPEEVIKAINSHFDTNFDSRFPEMEQIAEDMNRVYARYTGGLEQNNPNLPSAEKKAVKACFRSRVTAHPLAQPAYELYSRLVEIAL
jgi:hypothetical protein